MRLNFYADSVYTLTNRDYPTKNEYIERVNVDRFFMAPIGGKFYMAIDGALRAVRIINALYNDYSYSPNLETFRSGEENEYYPRYLEVEIAGEERTFIFEAYETLRNAYVKKSDYVQGKKESDEEAKKRFDKVAHYLFPLEQGLNAYHLLKDYCSFEVYNGWQDNVIRYSWQKEICEAWSHSANLVISYDVKNESFIVNYDPSLPYITAEEANADNKVECIDFDDDDTEEETSEFTINVSLKVKATKKAEAEKIVEDMLKKAKINQS